MTVMQDKCAVDCTTTKLTGAHCENRTENQSFRQ